MADEKTPKTTPSGTEEPQSAEDRRVKDATEEQLSNTLTPEQKHQNYIEHVKRLHAEP